MGYLSCLARPGEDLADVACRPDAATHLGIVAALATSAAGEIFAAEDNGAMAAFSEAAAGSMSPERDVPGAAEIAGGLSTLTVANGIAVDSSNNLYLLNAGGPDLMAVVIFGPTATSNVAPLRTITGKDTSMSFALSEATDSLGNLYM